MLNSQKANDAVYELNRALGALIYQNGPKLNNLILNQLLAVNKEPHLSKSKEPLSLLQDGLIYFLRNKIEADLELKLKHSNSEFESINRLNLITTQLIHNLTMPLQNEPGVFIDDKYKVKCVFLLIRIIRFHQNIVKSENDFKRVPNEDEFKLNSCKILTKALQGLENLFMSMQPVLTQPQQQQLVANLFNQSSAYFQLGDILAIAKVR